MLYPSVIFQNNRVSHLSIISIKDHSSTHRHIQDIAFTANRKSSPLQSPSTTILYKDKEKDKTLMTTIERPPSRS